MANPLLDALLADREGNSASGFSPMSAPTPAAGARMIDFDTPLPEMTPDAATSEDTLAFPEEVDQTYTPLDAPEPAESSAEIAPAPRANPLLAALQADQAATQQAVTEATTPDDRLPIISPDLADALGVLDYRDPQEGQRRQQAAAVGEILNLPMFERVNLGAAPVNADGTVTIRRAQAVSPEAQAAADQQMEIIRRDAAAEMNPPNRAVEAYNRAERGARLGVEDVRTGFYSIVEDFFRPQQNPYLEKSQATAIEDVPKLESRLADLQNRQTAFTKGDLGPNRDRISPFDAEISSLQNQLDKARQATTGQPVTENFLGSLSRASGDLSAEARENQLAIAADYTPEQIRPERNKEFWMTVADSLGRSAPTTASAILNPYLGLTLGYTQVFSNAESEFDQAAAQTGKPIDPEARAEYAHSQAVLQTPFELIGDLALAKVARDSIAASGKALMRSVKAGDPGAVTSFVSNLPRRAGQLAAAAAGETLITTPAQTVIEQKLAEAEGIRAPISNAELAARTGQAMQVAGAQSLLLGGGPVALETGVTTIADGIAARRQAPTSPTAPMGTPSSPTAPPSSAPQPAPGEVPQNLGQVRAPEIPIDQTALDEAFGPPPAAVNPQVNPDEVSNDTFAPPAATPRPAFSFSTDAITPEQTALARDFSARLTGQLRTQGILDTASTLDLAPVNLDRVDAGAPLADFIDNFSRLTGTRIQFVKASDPTIFGGAVRSDDAQTIYLNADSQRPVASLIGHEYGHTLQYSNPALYKDLRRVVATYTDSYRTRARESAAAPIYRTGPATQRVRTQTAELTNNTLGDAFLDPEFWRSVQNENRPLIQKIWTSFNEWVDSLLTRQSQSTWGTPQFSTDLTALRRDLAKTIAPALRPPTKSFGNAQITAKPGIIDLAIEAYHGTPHRVDRFSNEKIGTGEGAQAYGWGLYFAQNQKVADDYRDGLSQTEYWEGNNKLSGNRAWAALFLENNNRNRNSALLQARETIVNENAFSEVSKAISDIDVKNLEVKGGNLYTVDLDVEPEDLLDWDKPLSEQSPKVQAALVEIIAKTSKSFPSLKGNDSANGQGIYNAYSQHRGGNTKAASEALLAVGIPGIRYLDGDSRAEGQGTSNYVIFDENLIKVTAENGQPVSREIAKTIAPTFRGIEKANATEQSILSFATEPSAQQNILDALPRRGAIVKKKAEVKEDGTVYYNGKEPSQWSPEDFKAYGQEFGVRNLGPLSEISNIVDELGRPVAQIPGGLDGKFTYYDLLHLKANAVDVRKLPVELHGQLTAKLARTMTPERGNNVQKFNGILFGMLSPNSPLLPNEFGQARMRFSTMEEIKRFADLLPDNPTKEQRLSVNKRLKNELGFTEAKSGGLGIGISVDLSNIVMASKLFVKNPDFFIKKPKESWANFVDKLTTQVSGLGTKTASFGGVWQDPLNAGISAMDRHMARAFSDELINNPDIRGRFEGIVVNRFNNLLDVSKATVKTADAKIRKAKTDKAKAKAEQDKAAAMQNLPDPSALKADTLDDVLGQAEIFGADRIKDFVNEAVFAAMGSRKNKYLMKSGQVNPNLPESIQGVEWVKTPKDFQVMSEAYRLALDINAERAKSIGIEIFPAQWTLWDRIRGRVEPHEAMFPGLEKLPALNDRQLSEAFTANKRAGYASTPNPGQAWKRQEGVPASSLAYFAAEPKPRSFPQTVTAAPGVAPEVKAQLTALDYDPISNAQTVASARSRIDAAGSMDSAVTQFMGNAANPDFQPTAVDYATGIELLGQLQSRGRHEDAAAIADFMARAGTTQGQAIQALSLISRLTPAGIEAFASRQITRAARNDPKIEELIQDNQRLRAEIATAKRDSATAAIVDNRAAIKAALPAGADAVATNIAIREAILQSPTPLAAQAATARILQDNGLSERAAIRIAQSITKDFLKTTTDSRAKVLQDLLALAEKDRRFNKSKIGSLIRLNREGKLTDSRLHADMAKMLGIPAWTPEHSAKVQNLLRQREAATDPRVKLVKAAEALDVIYRESMPAGMLAKIDTFQTLMMLLNPKTWIRNIAGNAFMFGADISADTVAWGADAATSIVTGSRTRTGLDLATRITELGAGLGDIRAGYEFGRTQGLGRLGSFKEGVQTLIRLGRLYSSKKYDSAEITGFTGTTFQSGIGKALEDTLGAALSLADRGFYESAFRASLDNRMRTAATNGSPLAAPDPDMIAEARIDASRSIYQDDNSASRTLSGLRRVLNANQRWGLGSMLMKFTQVPGSILMRGIEFSPLGFIRNAYQLLAPALSRRAAFDQKAFTEQFSRALVGTTGLVATGYWLAQLGIISAGRENEDEKKRNLAKAEGWGSYKINVSALKRALITGNFWTRQPRQDGDVVLNYDWAQPLSISVAMGAYARDNQKAVQEDILRGKKQSLLATGFNWMSAAAASATGAMNALVEQPLLSGLSTFFRNAAYDDIPGAILAAAADVPKSMMPTAARQWMQLDDNTVRETRDSSPFRQYVNELKSQLPGLSQNLPAKRDILGNDVERYQRDSNTVFNVLFNPSMVTYIKRSPLLTEMSQVYEMTGNPSVIPNQAGRDFTLEGVKVRLTTEEISALQKDMGALSVAAVEKFVLDDPRYDKATWDIKAKAFTRALEKAATAAKYRILLSRPDLKERAQIEHQQTLQRRQEMQQMLDSGVGAALMQ